MNGTVLGALMMSNVDALTDEQKKDRSAVFAALGAAVVQHIQTTAVLSGLIVSGTCPSGAVTGTATGAPGSIT